jgi:hypothetical protein
MEEVFDEIEQNSSSEFDEEERNSIKLSMLEKNRETIQNCDQRDINLILLKRVYRLQKMVKMLGSSSISEQLKDTAESLEERIEKQRR